MRQIDTCIKVYQEAVAQSPHRPCTSITTRSGAKFSRAARSLSALVSVSSSVCSATPQLVQALFVATGQQMAALHAIADAAIDAGTPLDAIPWPPIYTPA